jgi:FkbM family methyltransferase
MEKYNTFGLRININDDKLLNPDLKNRLKTSAWEKDEAQSAKYIDSNASVLELGGCLGIVSLLINKRLNNPHKHVVLEPNPRLITFMETIKADNDGQYEIVNAFLSTSEETRDFSLHPNHIMGGQLGKRSGFETVQCKGVTMSYLEEKYNTTFDAIIMDIEHGEYDLYEKGFFDKDDMKNIKFLMIELHQNPKKESLRKHLDLSFNKCKIITDTPNNSVLIFEK